MAAEDQHAELRDLIDRVAALEFQVKALQDQVQASKQRLRDSQSDEPEPGIGQR